MNNKNLGEVYFRDYNGNFHKLETKDFNNELAELSTFDSIVTSSDFSVINCNYKPYFYHRLTLCNTQNCSLENNMIKLSNGLYRFSIYLTVSSKEEQNIYFFMRNKEIFQSSLQIKKMTNKIPNNINFNFICNIDKASSFEIAVLSKNKLFSIKSHILYLQLS